MFSNGMVYLTPRIFHFHTQWDSFTFTTRSRTTGYTSYPGIVTLVPSSGSIVGSGFLLSSESWTIEGNKAASAPAGYEPYSRGSLLNHYIVGTDDKVNVRATGAPDQSLWYFVAPSKFLGNVGIAYGGSLQFSLASFSGDFTKLNDKEVHTFHVYHLYFCVADIRVVFPFRLFRVS